MPASVRRLMMIGLILGHLVLPFNESGNSNLVNDGSWIRSDLHLTGGVVHFIRGQTENSNGGYNRHYVFDRRLLKTPPPFYPLIPDLEIIGWKDVASRSIYQEKVSTGQCLKNLRSIPKNTIHLSGWLAQMEVYKLKYEINRLVSHLGHHFIVLDKFGISFVDSGGIGVIVVRPTRNVRSWVAW
jgi:hypothetical protein